MRSLAYDPERDLLACGGMTNAKSNAFCPGDQLVVLVDGKTGQAQLQLKPGIKADGPINGLQFLPNGLLAGIGEGASGASLSFWNVEQPAPVHAIKMNSGYEVDLHPDGWQLAVSRFETNGRGGNGRHSTPEAYVGNDGVVDIFVAGVGTGGMATKLAAARHATARGCPTIIASKSCCLSSIP